MSVSANGLSAGHFGYVACKACSLNPGGGAIPTIPPNAGTKGFGGNPSTFDASSIKDLIANASWKKVFVTSIAIAAAILGCWIFPEVLTATAFQRRPVASRPNVKTLDFIAVTMR